jgi:hypothetical protein
MLINNQPRVQITSSSPFSSVGSDEESDPRSTQITNPADPWDSFGSRKAMLWLALRESHWLCSRRLFRDHRQTPRQRPDIPFPFHSFPVLYFMLLTCDHQIRWSTLSRTKTGPKHIVSSFFSMGFDVLPGPRSTAIRTRRFHHRVGDECGSLVGFQVRGCPELIGSLQHKNPTFPSPDFLFKLTTKLDGHGQTGPFHVVFSFLHGIRRIAGPKIDFAPLSTFFFLGIAPLMDAKRLWRKTFR